MLLLSKLCRKHFLVDCTAKKFLLAKIIVRLSGQELEQRQIPSFFAMISNPRLCKAIFGTFVSGGGWDHKYLLKYKSYEPE